MRMSFSSTLVGPPWSFSCCLSLAFEERNSTVDVISGILKTRSAESCSLQVHKRNPIRDHFLEIFTWLGVCIQQRCKPSIKPATLVKMGLLEISRRTTFWKMRCTCQVSWQSCKTLKFWLLYHNVIHHRRSPSNFENSPNKQRKYLWWTQFFVYLQVGGLGRSNFLKGTLLKTLFYNSPKLLKQQFFQHPQ